MLGQQGWLGLDGSVDGENYGVHCQDSVPARSPSGLDIRQVTYFLKPQFSYLQNGLCMLRHGGPTLHISVVFTFGEGVSLVCVVF